MGGCIVDYTSGMSLGDIGSGVDLDLAAAGNSQVVKAKLETMKSLGVQGAIQDILITLDTQLHIIRPCSQHNNLFIYLVLDKTKANLALARRKVENIEALHIFQYSKLMQGDRMPLNTPKTSILLFYC